MCAVFDPTPLVYCTFLGPLLLPLTTTYDCGFFLHSSTSRLSFFARPVKDPDFDSVHSTQLKDVVFILFPRACERRALTLSDAPFVMSRFSYSAMMRSRVVSHTFSFVPHPYQRLHAPWKVMGSAAVRSGCPLLLLVRLILELATAAASGLGKGALVSFDPPFLHELVEGHNATVVFSLSVPSDQFEEDPSQEWNLKFRSLHEDVATTEHSRTVSRKDFNFNNDTRFYTLNSTFIVRGVFLGKTGVRVKLVPGLSDYDGDEEGYRPPKVLGPEESKANLDVWVKRGAESLWLNRVFVTTLIVLISIANVLMGCELDLNVVLDTVKRPIAPIIGLCSQFLVMPLLAYTIAHAVFVSQGLYSFALGIFVTGCSPGGGASNFWTVLLDGNAHLSITMTFLSTVASLVMMPTWLYLLGSDFLSGYSTTSKIRVPYTKIVTSLISMVLPLLIGVAISKWKPAWGLKARKAMRPFIVFVLVFIIAFGTYANLYMFRIMTWRALLGGLLLPWCGFMFGCFGAIIFRRSPPDVTAIAIETGIQNTGIAILLLKFSFPDPDADISALLPVIVACFTPGPLMLGVLVHYVAKYIKKGRGDEISLESGEMKVKESTPAETLDGSASQLLPPAPPSSKVTPHTNSLMTCDA